MNANEAIAHVLCNEPGRPVCIEWETDRSQVHVCFKDAAGLLWYSIDVSKGEMDRRDIDKYIRERRLHRQKDLDGLNSR